jgi:hypothetical protein
VVNRTIKDIEKLIIDQLEAQFNFKIPLLSKAFNRVLAKVLAGVWQINYKTGNWIFLQLFVSTASFKSFTVFGKTVTPLIEWGRLIGAGDPEPGNQAILTIDVNVNSPGQDIRSGEQFISSINNVIYITTQSYTLVGPVDTIEVISTEIGEVGNLNSGDPISLVNPIGIIDRDAVVNTRTTDGENAESELSYRTRVEDLFKQRPQGGAYVDYRVWASEVPGVLQTYWYSGDIPTHVIGYVSGIESIYPDRIPNSALLLAVGDAVDFETVNGDKVSTRRPVGAIIDPAGDKSYENIKPVTIKGFEVDIIDLVAEDLPTVKSLISDSLNSYFKDREPYIEGQSFPPVKNNVNQSSVIGIVNTIVLANNGSFLTAILKIDTVTVPNYILEESELANMDLLTYNGV